MRRIIPALMTFSALALCALWAPSILAADNLIDTQDTAVATNLELYGGLPTDINVDPTGDGQVVYVTTYTPNGIFRSQDAGVTWQGLPSSVDYGAGKAIVVDATTGAVYVAIGDELIVSTDQGETWTTLTENLISNPIVGSEIALVNDTLLLAVDNGAVQISEDNGQTFTEVVLSAGTSNSIVSMAGTSAERVYAVMLDNGTEATELFVSDDTGASWTKLDIEAAGVASNSIFHSVAVDPLNENHVVLGSYHPDYDSYHTFNAGTSWTALQNAGNSMGGTNVVFDGVGGMYIGTNYTNDASVVSPTWSAITTDTSLSSVRGNVYAVDATHPTTIYSDTAMGVAKSEDGGTSWIDSIEGITAAQTYAISQANDKDVVWLGVNGGLAKTANFTDDSVEWDYPISPPELSETAYAVWVKPSDGDYVVTGLSAALYYTEDGGTTWTPASAPSISGTIQHIVQSPNNADRLYAVSVDTSLVDAATGGVLKSTDAGKTWTDLSLTNDLPATSIVVANNDGKDIVYVGLSNAGSETGVYRHKNDTWTKLDKAFNGLTVNSLAVSPDNADTLFASLEADSTEGSLYRSIDAGEQWEKITDGLSTANHLDVMAFHPKHPATMFMTGQEFGNAGMIYKSTDSGDSWSRYYTGLKQEFFYTLLFDGLVAGNDRGIFDLKSLGKLTLKVKKQSGKHKITSTLKDASTKKKLSKRKLIIYRKKGDRPWKVLAKRKTSKQGKVQLNAVLKKNTKLKTVWKPAKKDRAEYTKTVSGVAQVK